jgi:hypothetical protein
MKEPTLDEFLLEVVGGRGNAYVRFPGFATLYVRFTKRYLLGKMQSPVLDLANMVAKKPGKGAFTALFEHIRTAYPEVWIYVECVQTPRFERKLEDMGFKKSDHSSLSACFYMEPQAGPNEHRS